MPAQRATSRNRCRRMPPKSEAERSFRSHKRRVDFSDRSRSAFSSSKRIVSTQLTYQKRLCRRQITISHETWSIRCVGNFLPDGPRLLCVCVSNLPNWICSRSGGNGENWNDTPGRKTTIRKLLSNSRSESGFSTATNNWFDGDRFLSFKLYSAFWASVEFG